LYKNHFRVIELSVMTMYPFFFKEQGYDIIIIISKQAPYIYGKNH